MGGEVGEGEPLVAHDGGVAVDVDEAEARGRGFAGAAVPVEAGEADPGVYVRISDQGPGIEARHLPRLGERFYRADESRGGEITGTGLGLAIVKHIIARHRGGFAVETRLGRGSAFAVWLPAASVDALSYAR